MTMLAHQCGIDNTMLTHQWKDWKESDGMTLIYSQKTWKPYVSCDGGEGIPNNIMQCNAFPIVGAMKVCPHWI
jgi:hypothetical protein